MNRLKQIIANINKKSRTILLELKHIDSSTISGFVKRRKWIIFSIFIIFIIIGFYCGVAITSKEVLIKKLDASLKSGSAKKIYRQIKINDKNVTKKDLEPLISYYLYENNKVDSVIKELNNTGKSGVFNIISNKGIFFDKYYLELKTVDIDIKTNFEESKIYLNDELLDKEKYKKGLVPGIYIVRGELDTDYGTVEKEEKIYLMEDEVVNINLDAKMINIISNYDDAKVFINDKYTGKTIGEQSEFGPVPLEEEITIYLEKEFPWGVIKSDKVKIADNYNLNININMVNDILLKEVNDRIQKFYESVFNALNKKDYTLIEFTDEDTKRKIYQQIEKKSIILKNNYDISKIDTEIESSTFEQINNSYKAKLVIKINYDVYKKFLPFLNEKIEETILTTIEYRDGGWMIDDIQKFNFE